MLLLLLFRRDLWRFASFVILCSLRPLFSRLPLAWVSVGRIRRPRAVRPANSGAPPPTVTVYLDMKSPHAYLILAPALQVARDYHVKVEFKPYELSFVDMGAPALLLTLLLTPTAANPPPRRH